MILLTGATGTVGGHVARELKSAGVSFVALVRDRARGEQALGSEVEMRVADYERPDTLVVALRDVDRVLLLAPLVPQLAELEGNVIDAAVGAGVRHVVKLSTAGVGQVSHPGGASVPRQYPLHRRAEEHLEQSGIAFTQLRPGPFMQNTLNFASSIAATGVFRGAWGDGAMGYVDVRDVAAAATRILVDDSYSGETLELTGPEALSPVDIAQKLSAAIGREVRYENVPGEAVRQAMLSRGMSDWFAGAMVEVMEHTSTGAAANVTRVISEVTGRQPRTYDNFAHEFAGAFPAD